MSNTSDLEAEALFRTGTGLTYMTTTAGFAALYATVLKIIISDAELMSNAAYKIIISIGVADLIQHLGLGLGGVILLSRCTCTWLSKVSGALAGFGWCGQVTSTTLLGLNRLGVFSGSLTLEQWFDTKTKILIALCWAYGVLWMVGNVTWFHFTFFADYFIFDYEILIVSVLDPYINCAWFSVTACFYIGCVYHVHRIQAAHQDSQEMRAEYRIGIQAALIWVSSIMLMCVFILASRIMGSNKYAWVLMAVVWIWNTGINPIIYILLNKYANLFIFTSEYFARTKDA